MNRIAQWIRDWMLPGAIVLGTGLYLLYHFLPVLHPYGRPLQWIASEGQRMVIALLLFFQFVKVPPGQIRPRPWHWKALGIQAGAFLLLASGVLLSPVGSTLRMLLECAMLCMVCPTASAAGVVTDRLGGDLAATVSYVFLINVAATFLIPLGIPVVNPSAQMGFWTYVGHLAWKVFPVLILPGLLAWLVRYTLPGLQERLFRWAPNSFYIWGVGLTLAMVLATRALILSHLGWAAIGGIVGVSLACCAFQFIAGHSMGRTGDSVTSGQALGQKNTGFLIWLGYSYLTPVTSVAGGLYAIWQNLYNAWELKRQKCGR